MTHKSESWVWKNDILFADAAQKRLIEALPRLLAACEAVFAWSQSCLPMDAMDDEVLEQVIDALRAAGSASVDDKSLNL